jgi:hypothetical protein
MPITEIKLVHLPVLVSATSAESKDFILANLGQSFVRQIHQDDLKKWVRRDTRFRKKFASQFGEVSGRMEAALWLALGLADGFKNESPDAIRAAAENYVRRIPEAKVAPIIRNPREEFSRVVNRGIEAARYVMWFQFEKNAFRPGLYCLDTETALFALALMGMGQSGSMGICPWCTNQFFRIRPSKKYCSANCQAAAGMARLRNRGKEPDVS